MDNIHDDDKITCRYRKPMNKFIRLQITGNNVPRDNKDVPSNVKYWIKDQQKLVSAESEKKVLIENMRKKGIRGSIP